MEKKKERKKEGTGYYFITGKIIAQLTGVSLPILYYRSPFSDFVQKVGTRYFFRIGDIPLLADIPPSVLALYLKNFYNFPVELDRLINIIQKDMEERREWQKKKIEELFRNGKISRSEYEVLVERLKKYEKMEKRK